MEKQHNLENKAFIMDSDSDQVAIAKEDISAGEQLSFRGEVMAIKDFIRKGQRFAVTNISEGEFVQINGFPFGRSKGIVRGEAITVLNIDNVLPETGVQDFKAPETTSYLQKYLQKTFSGYVRNNGSVGTRNYYLVIPTSMCASETALQIARALEEDKEIFQTYPSIDGIVAIPHTEGCGCDSGFSIDRLMRVLRGYVRHPNVGGCLIVDLGCEQANYEKMHSYLQGTLQEGLKPIDWITIEKSGGVKATREESDNIIRSRLSVVARTKRTTCPIEKLVVGTECGASDAFSGITANPVIGNGVDKIISGKGSAILSEIPEMMGTFEMLFPRFRSLEIAHKFKGILEWYSHLAAKLGLSLESNLVPKNLEAGLINNYIKSLGAVLKGGTSVIEDILDYGEPVKTRGLSIMQGPGGDPESLTGIVASGANIVCFSTGYGTPTGNAICPVVKIASNDEVFQRLSDDLDFNAGKLLSGQTSVDALGEELFDLVIEVASGRQTAAERLKQRQFQIWTAGKLPL